MDGDGELSINTTTNYNSISQRKNEMNTTYSLPFRLYILLIWDYLIILQNLWFIKIYQA